MFHYIAAHQLISAVVGYFFFSNAVQALEPPDDKSSKGYRWFFCFSHGLAGNLKYAFQKLAPQYVDPSK